MRITLAQFTCREGDIAHNLAAVLAQIERCSGQTDLLVLPETQLTGFTHPDGNTDYALQLQGPELAQVVAASQRTGIAVAVGFLEQDGAQLFNSSVLITPEQGIYLHYRKAIYGPTNASKHKRAIAWSAGCGVGGVLVY